ncbi:MAG: type II toxin-antitoxin system HigB family toxin [Bacteroidales bacterium]|nr:type II toxin-antitoxin system HigB family toxin [Bacteroidales bacterium]
MRIVAKRALVEFYTKHSGAKTALEEWHKKTKKAKWLNFADVKKTFRSADFVGNGRVVFNIKGNDYRLVALILFTVGMVYIRFVGTHDEYDNIIDIKTL